MRKGERVREGRSGQYNMLFFSVQLQPFIVYIARRGVVAVIVKMLKLQAAVELSSMMPGLPGPNCFAEQDRERRELEG